MVTAITVQERVYSSVQSGNANAIISHQENFEIKHDGGWVAESVAGSETLNQNTGAIRLFAQRYQLDVSGQHGRRPFGRQSLVGRNHHTCRLLYRTNENSAVKRPLLWI